jgi:hypothetical protein
VLMKGDRNVGGVPSSVDGVSAVEVWLSFVTTPVVVADV